ncbi:MAG: hypothetical protein OIF57_15575 [Marinobacterium sp.]|nr:hypothetical protein [Marinobacterium sp.]
MWLCSSLCLAQVPQQDIAVDPLLIQLQSLQQMRGRLEQDMAQYLDEARAKSGVQPMQPGNAPEVRQMRQDVQANLQRLEDRFRCLDVDIQGNNGNVVLVCGNNQGAVSSNTQQAFGADLNIKRPSLRGGGAL